MHIIFYVIVAPVLSTLSQIVNAVLGDSVSLTCTSQGSPPDTFIWMKDGVELQNNIVTTSVTYTSTMAVFQSTYSIDNFSNSDTGTYTCTITNPIGTDSLNVSLDTIIGKQV